MDPKSIGLCPQGFESPRCRQGTAAMPRVTPVQSMTQLLCSCRRVVGQANSKTSTAQVPSQTPLALHGPQLLKCGQPMASLVTLGGSHSSTSDRVHPAHDSVSERPRRWTRNPLGSARRGSNPLAVDKSELRRHGWHFLAQRSMGCKNRCWAAAQPNTTVQECLLSEIPASCVSGVPGI